MDIILLERIENLGDLGDRVRVKPGYARNFLIPTGKAKFATPANIAEFEQRREEIEQAAQEAKTSAEARAQQLNALGPIRLSAHAGSAGKLFGSISSSDIAEAVSKAGVPLARREVQMPGSLRSAGAYDVKVRLHTEVEATLQVIIEGVE